MCAARYTLSHSGLSAANVLGKITRELHLAVPREDAKLSKAEKEANRQALWNENAEVTAMEDGHHRALST
jgi:hypothetical protein